MEQKTTLRERVATVLEQEAKHSYVGVKDDLHRLDDIEPLDLTRDGTIPVVSVGHVPDTVRARPDVAKKRLATLHATITPSSGELKEIIGKILGTSLVLAGGAVSRSIWLPKHAEYMSDGWGRQEELADLDLFIVGLSEEEATRQINILAEGLATIFKSLAIYRSERCITFRGKYNRVYGNPLHGRSAEAYNPITTTIQVVLRLYNTVSEIIHGFDLGSSAVAYYGGEIVMSSKGRFAFERGLNILDLSRRRASYETRIVKYAKRGFGVVLPDLDAAKLVDPDAKPTPNKKFPWRKPEFVFQLPRLTIVNPHCSDGELVAQELEARFLPSEEPEDTRALGFPLTCSDDFKVADSKEEHDAKALIDSPPEDAKAADDLGQLLASPIAENRNVLGIIYAYVCGSEQPDDIATAFKSEYEGGDYFQYKLGNVTWNNLRQARRATVKTASLCLISRYIPGVDVCTAGTPFLGLHSILAAWCDQRKPNVATLESLLGKEVARRVVVQILDKTFVGAGRLADALTAEYTPRAAIPFRFMRVEETTCLAGGGVLRMALMSPAEWYGEFIRANS
ncbi:MAG: hypothetical protein KGL39_18795 [Patescibacteria group bacterium]|nr:hypothetical protein [Patescibacteria group bacterium]